MSDLPDWLLDLKELTEQRVVVFCQDGTVFRGKLKTLDQFGNVGLDNASQRISAGELFADLPLGALIVRGDTIAMFGREEAPTPCQEATLNEVMRQRRSMQIEAETRRTEAAEAELGRVLRGSSSVRVTEALRSRMASERLDIRVCLQRSGPERRLAEFLLAAADRRDYDD